MIPTPWGDLDVNDAHVHFFSPGFYAGLARQRGVEGPELGPLLGWEIPEDVAGLARRWVEELDRHGVGRAALIASAPGDEESVAAAVLGNPERFYGYFMLDPTQPDAVERVTMASKNTGLHGMCLFPAMQRYSVNDARLEPIFEIASASRLAVFVHCGVLSVGVRKKLGLPSPFDIRFSNPLDLHPMAVRFPQVRFVVPHFGAGMLREALMLADLCPNIWLDTSSTNRWLAYDGLDLETVFRRSLEVIGPGRLLFGSDSSFFPRGWHADILKRQIEALSNVGIDPDQARQILGQNLERLLSVSRAE